LLSGAQVFGITTTMKTLSALFLPAATAALALGYLGAASAAPITCGSLQRFATFDSAESCSTGEGNPGAGTILSHYAGDAWTSVGELNESTGEGTNGFLTLDFTQGGFNSAWVDATWSISSSFWSTYSEAVFSIHVGNGGGSPDYFAWLVTPGETSGTLSYDRFLSGGGGFSNARLWARGVAVPEPGALTLLGAGLAAVLVARRRRKAE
jgi:hypothetical protein